MASSSSRASRSGQKSAPSSHHGFGGGGRRGGGALDGERRAPGVAIDLDLHARIGDGAVRERARDRRQRDALGVARPVGLEPELLGRILDGLLELGVGHGLVDQPPLDRARALHALLDRAEGIGQVAPHLALVGDAREPAGARQHGQQRQLRQRHRRVAVVGEQDVVGRQRQLVAAARRRAAHGADVLLAGGAARILHGVARLVGELAEVDLVGVGGAREHADVGAGAEHAVLAGPEDHDLHLGVLEAQPLHGVGELDVDAQIVGVELQLVAVEQPGVLVDVHDQLGDLAIEARASSGDSAPARSESRCVLPCSGTSYGRRKVLIVLGPRHQQRGPRCIIILL